MLIAILEIYRDATKDYKQTIKFFYIADFIKIKDAKTEDSDCKSIQTITSHIKDSGYTYANYFNSISKRDWLEYTENIDSLEKEITEIDKMLIYTEKSFQGVWHKSNTEIGKIKINTRGNVTYDFEQLLEHAIVYVLRHNRQVKILYNKHAFNNV